MGKPLNRIALFIWIVAGLVALSQIIAEPILHHMTLEEAPEFMRPDARLSPIFWHLSAIRSGVVTATLLIAAGAVVELIDQIRWNALPPDQRNRG